MADAFDLLQVRAIVTDADVLGRLDSAAVAAHLAGSGWTQTGERSRGTVWAREIDSRRAAAVMVPNDPLSSDYAIRMGRVLTTLARVEDRSQLAILVDLYGHGKEAQR